MSALQITPRMRRARETVLDRARECTGVSPFHSVISAARNVHVAIRAARCGPRSPGQEYSLANL